MGLWYSFQRHKVNWGPGLEQHAVKKSWLAWPSLSLWNIGCVEQAKDRAISGHRHKIFFWTQTWQATISSRPWAPTVVGGPLSGPPLDYSWGWKIAPTEVLWSRVWVEQRDYSLSRLLGSPHLPKPIWSHHQCPTSQLQWFKGLAEWLKRVPEMPPHSN